MPSLKTLSEAMSRSIIRPFVMKSTGLRQQDVAFIAAASGALATLVFFALDQDGGTPWISSWYFATMLIVAPAVLPGLAEGRQLAWAAVLSMPWIVLPQLLLPAQAQALDWIAIGAPLAMGALAGLTLGYAGAMAAVLTASVYLSLLASCLLAGRYACLPALMAAGGLVLIRMRRLARQAVEDRQARNDLEVRSEALGQVLQAFPGAIALVDAQGRLAAANAEAHVVFPAAMSTRTPPERSAGTAKGLAREERTERVCPDGRILDVRSVRLDNGGLLRLSLDITPRRRGQPHAQQTDRDGLTGLATRRQFHERVGATLEGRRNSDAGVALISIDIDDFKEVNETFGHPAGDRILVELSRRFTGCLREGDLIARLSGDEFCIMQRVYDPLVDAEALAMRLFNVARRPHELGSGTISVDVSMGIAIAAAEDPSLEECLRQSELALLEAKSSGGNRFRFYDSVIDLTLMRRRALKTCLKTAIQRAELELYFQPIINLGSGIVSCVEVLLRWNSRQLGSVTPETFIPLAEDSDLIGPIGEWVLGKACEAACRLPAPVRIAVNVSPAQFQNPGFIACVRNILASSGLDPQRLELEVTESLMLREKDGVFERLNELRGLGVRLALDDFGSGYSSFSLLKKFRFDKIKIDRSLVCDLSYADDDGRSLLRSIARIGVTLGVATTVEGIETQEQLDIVRLESCSEAQGYLISPPVPEAELANAMQNAPTTLASVEAV